MCRQTKTLVDIVVVVVVVVIRFHVMTRWRVYAEGAPVSNPPPPGSLNSKNRSDESYIPFVGWVFFFFKKTIFRFYETCFVNKKIKKSRRREIFVYF